MTLAHKKHDLILKLSRLRGVQERFAFLVGRARQQTPLDPEFRTESFRVEGCLSNLWFVPDFRDGKCWFRCDSDSLIVKAIAGTLCEFYSGHTPEEILATDPSFLAEVGITQHLTPNRRNALSGIWERIRAFAQAQQPPAARPATLGASGFSA